MAEPANVTTLPAMQVFRSSADVFDSPALFEHSQRVAKVFATSTLVPEHLRKNGVSDVLLAYAIAKRMGEDPVIVMQNIYFVSGRAGWKSEYMIARANKSGVFKGRINWRTTGTGDAMSVTAFAKLADTGEEVTASTSFAMAKAEGWTRNSKYQTMPEHMLRWRSATMLIRLFAPEVMLGMPTSDELEDIQPLHVGSDGVYAPIPGSPADLDAALEAAAQPQPETPPAPVETQAEIIPPFPAGGELEAVRAALAMLATNEAVTAWEDAHKAEIARLPTIRQKNVRAEIGERRVAINEAPQA